MSDPHTGHGHDPVHGAAPHAAGHGDARSEEDRVSAGKIIAVGVASLVVFFLASLAAVTYLDMRLGEQPPIPIPKEIGQSKIGVVEQQLFDVAVRGTRDRAQRQERLRSYGWVDPGGGVVHIPIDRAMELVVNGVRPPADGAPPPAQGAQP
jgi:hypothetical protein